MLRARSIRRSSCSARRRASGAELRALSQHHRLALAGGGAGRASAGGVDVLVLTGDPVAEADRVTGALSAGA
jgi:hypothetical protein